MFPSRRFNDDLIDWVERWSRGQIFALSWLWLLPESQYHFQGFLSNNQKHKEHCHRGRMDEDDPSTRKIEIETYRY